MQAADRQALREVLSDRGWSSVLDRLREQWLRYGEPKGRLTIASGDEALAVGGLIGRHLLPGKTLNVRSLDAELRTKARFAVGLKEILEIRFGELKARPTLRRAARARSDHGLALIRERLAAAALPADTAELAERWLTEKTSDIRRRISLVGPDAFAAEVETVFRAIAHLRDDGEPILLPVLATLAASDAHAFDAGSRLGTLLDRVLEFRHPEIIPHRRYSYRSHLHAAAGIVRNRISARVDTFGLIGDSVYMRALGTRDLDRTLTLRSLEQLKHDGVRGNGGVAFVVENASVFEHLVNVAATLQAPGRPTLICTNGWLNAADRMLLRMLVLNGTQIYYSGDFDEAGLAIALEVQRLYSARLWRMTAEAYEHGAGQRQLRARCGNVERFRDALPKLTSAIDRSGRGVHQEAIIDLLESDLREAASGFAAPITTTVTGLQS